MGWFINEIETKWKPPFTLWQSSTGCAAEKRAMKWSTWLPNHKHTRTHTKGARVRSRSQTKTSITETTCTGKRHKVSENDAKTGKQRECCCKHELWSIYCITVGIVVCGGCLKLNVSKWCVVWGITTSKNSINFSFRFSFIFVARVFFFLYCHIDEKYIGYIFVFVYTHNRENFLKNHESDVIQWESRQVR